MKSLELELNKKLLIVESENANEFFIMKNIPVGTYFIMCKGPELSQSLIEPFLDKKTDDYGIYWYRDYTVIDEELHDAYVFLNPKESFISAIESKGWFWSKNDLTDSILAPDIDEWQDAQSKTFNPEKCIIFEIL
ncbi:hypothetical protein [Chryseobacterium rhizosphaerae]|uniref:hypothetical protein n=1 Tax=Chryseobacterium rhizosphaerae TaxID=395937 RepID=UPI003D0CB7C2